MATFKSIAVLFVVFMLLFLPGLASACSMYKITTDGKTMVGCNHDTWYLTPRIWFENTGYGAGFTGARSDGNNGFAPQSGMNEFGLAFSRLAAASPKNGIAAANKTPITNPTRYLKDILHKCKTVDEVRNYIAQYDHSYFRKRSVASYTYIKLALFPISLAMAYYMFVLENTINIFYFPAPYRDHEFSLLNIAAYIPFFVLFAIIPLAFINGRLFISKSWGLLSRWLFTLNNLTYITLIGFFIYWGLYDVFS